MNKFQAEKPATTSEDPSFSQAGSNAAQSAHQPPAPNLRGDYSHVHDDYTVDQEWEKYSDAEHALWRELYQRQSAILPGKAADDFIANLARMDAANAIPRFDKISEQLFAATGWRLVAVPGLVPDDAFFDHLANRRFPVTVWLRKPEEIDYLVEPDIFHDFFGHVPMLFDPVFADYLAAYGAKGPEAIRHGALKQLARLYWYMVEFGLIKTTDGLRAYGAGMLSSKSETLYCLSDPKPNRIGFALERVMRTDYKIDDFQKTYFVLESYEQLFEATSQDFEGLYARLAALPVIPPSGVLASDRVYHFGNEGYAFDGTN
ncbi:phenylalanine 4-monooxygenase [Thalassospira marina]|uniref:Phenylalanine-4-hydroxylase n=1 Tax=Thalassospira marina TaxID=2048283 RepID=A0A2N3KUG9_9PROT|nr:phenylalanine 4-monooxygenase [Thalassospira marina]PKR54178.1 phenylalanine 4-monooxygenase [Thalassospira marina]